MNIKERLSFFQEIVQCEYPLHLWRYDPDFELIKTDCPAEMMLPDIISMLGFSSLVLSHIESGKRLPLILDTEFGLLWIAGFEYRGFELKQIHIMGPAFTGSSSHLILRKKLDSYQLTVKLRSKIVRQIESVPIIPSSTLLSYAVMFHCAITGEKISADMISFSSHSEATDTDELTLIADEHPGIWMAEQTFLSMIREGNPDYRRALGKSMTLSSGMKVELGDTLRANKNNLLVLLTLCSRAAIEGGLNPSTAYTLNDYYGKRIEECKTTADTNNLGNELLDDYVSRVRTAHETDEHAKQIADICDYITLHIREPLSISLLSKRLGYTEYYFSHKFKDVMGKSVNNYIRQKKTEEAKLLLSGTHMSISEMSCHSAAAASFFPVSRRKPACHRQNTGSSIQNHKNIFCCLSLTDTISARRHPIFFLKNPMKIADIVIADRHGDIHHIHGCRAEQICCLTQPLCLNQICIGLSCSFSDLL